MEPIFRKCLKAIEQINEKSFPAMGMAYKQYIESSKKAVLNSSCLNDTKAYALAASEALHSGYIDNSSVRSALDKLANLDNKLKHKSKDLHELLSNNESRYKKLSKELVAKNTYYLNEMKNGTTPAPELLQDIVSLGKSIQKVINEDIPNFQREVMAFLQRTESNICDSAYHYYNSIQKLDHGTLPRIKTREWVYMDRGLFERVGAFEHNAYEGVS